MVNGSRNILREREKLYGEVNPPLGVRGVNMRLAIGLTTWRLPRMSVRVMSLCWGIPTDTASLLTLLALADHANDSGASIYPGNKRLSHKVGMSVRQVQRVLSHLEEHGLISRAKYAAGGKGHAVEWVINSGVLERVTSGTPFEDAKGDTCDRKGCHLSSQRVTWVTPQPSGTIMNHQEPVPQVQRNPGEKWPDYLRRIASEVSE